MTVLIATPNSFAAPHRDSPPSTAPPTRSRRSREHSRPMHAAPHLQQAHHTRALESTTSFFAAGRAGVVRAEAVPLHRGRRTTVWQTRVTEEAGRLLAVTIQTQMVLAPE